MGRAVHGAFEIPDNYFLVILPANAEFETLPPYSDAKVKLCSNYNVLKIIVALAQALYSITTLYNTRGDQIERFGYAAFGLTATPYLYMSLMNLLGNLIRPDYPTLYLTESQDMREAMANGATFDGTVGKLTSASEMTLYVCNRDLHTSFRPGVAAYGAAVLGAVPIGIIGGLTHFQKGYSTHAQRVWIMMWIVIGIFNGAFLHDSLSIVNSTYPSKMLLSLCMVLYLSAPAIGAFVVVVQQMKSYGVCKEI